jgi:hypothetical protein
MNDVELPRCFDGAAGGLRVNVEVVGRKTLEKVGEAVEGEGHDDVHVARQAGLTVVHRRMGAADHVREAEAVQDLNEVSQQLGLCHREASGRPGGGSLRETNLDAGTRSTR